MYETIEQKLKHVSKSFAAKFDWYESTFKESKNEIEALILRQVSDRDNESIQESECVSQMEEMTRELELNAQLQGAKIKRL